MIVFFKRLLASKIQTRLIFYYAGFATITLVFVVYLAYIQVERSLLNTVDDKLDTVARLKVDFLDQWVDDQQRNAIFLAELPELRTLSGILLGQDSSTIDRARAKDELTDLVTLVAQRSNDIQDVQILDPDGVIVISASPAHIGRSQSGEIFFIEGQTHTFTQKFYKSDLFGKTTLTVATPLLDGNNRRIGVIALHFNMREVDEIIREVRDIDTSFHGYLITSNREIISEDPLILSQTPELRSYAIDAALNGQTGTASYINHEGVAVVGKYMWIENQNAALVVEVRQDVALMPARRLAINVFLIGSILSLILVLIVVFLVGRMMTPLRVLTDTVTRISAGDLDAVALVRSDDEVGTLAAAFNSMTEKLRQSLTGLQNELQERKQAEEELLQFRKLMDETNEAIFLIDPGTSGYLDFNKVAHESLGYTRAELKKLGVIDIALHITSMEIWNQRVDLVREAGQLIFETTYRRKDHTTFPVEVSARMLDYNDQNIMVALARDITSHKTSETALRESEEKFRKMFHSSPIAICISTVEDGRIIDANYAYWDLIGLDEKTTTGKNLVDLAIWDDQNERNEFVKILLAKHSHYDPDSRFIDHNGRLKSTLAFYELIEIGGQEHILSMFYDMSAQKQIMQALQESEARTSALLEAIPDLIFEIKYDGTFLKMIPSSTEEFFLPVDQFIIGRQVGEVMPPVVAQQILSIIQQVMAGGRLETLEYQLSLPNGIRDYEARIVASGEISVLAIVRDITQRKWVETEREQFIHELELKNRESETLRNSLAQIVTTFDLVEVINHILDRIKEVIPYDTASVWRVENEWQTLIVGRDLPADIPEANLKFKMDKDNSSRPVVTGEAPYIVNNQVQDELPDFQGPHSYVNSWLVVPLKKRNKIIGLIALDGRQKGQFTEHHAELAIAFANQAAIALDNMDLLDDLQNELITREKLILELEARNAEAETMRASLASVVGSLELSEIMQRILEQIRRVIPYDSASIWQLKGGDQVLIGQQNLPDDVSVLGLKFPVDEQNHALPIFNSEVPYIISGNVQSELTTFQESPHTYINSWLGAPMRARGKIIGLIALDGREKNQFNERHAQLAVMFADQVAIALENASLFTDLQDQLRKQIALRSASMSISSSLQLDQVLNEICRQLCVINDGTSAYIAQYNGDYSTYTIVAEYMGDAANADEKVSDLGIAYHKKDGAWLFDEAATSEYKVIHSDDAALTPWYENVLTEYGDRSILYVPLYVQGRLLGHAELWDSRTRREFTREEILFCRTLSQQAAIAIANANLFEQLQGELSGKKSLIGELESKNAELERFTYTVSHDLKSPLFTIRGFLGFLEQDALNGNLDRLKKDIQRIADAAEKMQALLNDLLELSRIGRLKNDSISIPFGELVNEAVELVQGRIMGRDVKVVIQPNLPAIFGDRPRLLEVIQNLIDNAAKFMGAQPQPLIEIGQDGQEDGKAILFIRDNGIGVAPEHFDRIFGLFNKLDVKSEGTGIGLALVKRIIEVHGGRIWLQSEVGLGTTFYFTLPYPPDGPVS